MMHSIRPAVDAVTCIQTMTEAHGVGINAKRRWKMKQVYSRRELVEMGYPDTELKLIARSEDAYKVGFHGTRGSGVSNKFFFVKEKLDKYLEWREKIR